MKEFWRQRSLGGKFALIFVATVVGLIALGSAMEGGETSSDTSAESQPNPQSQSQPNPQSQPVSEAAPSTPKERLQNAVGDEVHAGGYAGDLQIQDVSFEGREAQVTVETPEGGFQGASCGDLDDGAQAIFETIYNDADWNGGVAIIYKGGLVDRATGQELPDANTGIFTIHAGQAQRIDWTDEDALSYIDWSIYRDFCHPALQ